MNAGSGTETCDWPKAVLVRAGQDTGYMIDSTTAVCADVRGCSDTQKLWL